MELSLLTLERQRYLIGQATQIYQVGEEQEEGLRFFIFICFQGASMGIALQYFEVDARLCTG
jgi:hypothetical protein